MEHPFDIGYWMTGDTYAEELNSMCNYTLLLYTYAYATVNFLCIFTTRIEHVAAVMGQVAAPPG